jgi:hypothetical protein
VEAVVFSVGLNPLMHPSQVGTRNRGYKYPDHR